MDMEMDMEKSRPGEDKDMKNGAGVAVAGGEGEQQVQKQNVEFHRKVLEKRLLDQGYVLIGSLFFPFFGFFGWLVGGDGCGNEQRREEKRKTKG